MCNPDPTSGTFFVSGAAKSSSTSASHRSKAKGGLLLKLKELQETINDLQRQLTDITEELEGTGGDSADE